MSIVTMSGASDRICSIASIPSMAVPTVQVKGQLVFDEQPLDEVLEKLSKSELPALWRPRPNQFLKVETLPYLGTGKLDLRKAREIAQQLARPE